MSSPFSVENACMRENISKCQQLLLSSSGLLDMFNSDCDCEASPHYEATTQVFPLTTTRQTEQPAVQEDMMRHNLRLPEFKYPGEGRVLTG